MQRRITFRGRDHSEALDKEINKQLEKIENFLEHERTPKSIEITVEFHDTHQHHSVTVHVKSPNYNCYAKHEGPDVHAEIKEVLDRIYRQLRDEKKKHVDNQKHGCGKVCRNEDKPAPYVEEELILELEETELEEELEEKE